MLALLMRAPVQRHLIAQLADQLQELFAVLAGSGGESLVKGRVITSYSIHYTKLYEIGPETDFYGVGVFSFARPFHG